MHFVGSARTTARTTRRLLAVGVILCGVVSFVSCGGEGPGSITAPDSPDTTPPVTTPPTTTPPPAGTSTGSVSAITLVPSAMSLTLGDSSQFIESLTTTGSPPTAGWTVAWQSTNPSVLSVGTDGTVKALAEGTAAVSATADGKTATAVVTVGPKPWVNSVAVSPPSAVMLVGDQLAMTALLGTVGTPPTGGWPVSWQSNQTSVATVSSTGVVTAVAPGSTTIFANSGVAAGSSTVKVVSGPTVLGIALAPATLYLAAGDSGSFSPALTTVGTAPSGGWPITWTSASPAIATVNAAGVVTGVAPGSTTISATSGAQTAAATVAVSTPSGGTTSIVTAVSIEGFIAPRILAGGTRALIATVSANGPPPASGWVATWVSSNPAVLKVSGDGATGAVVTGVAPGAATLTATVGGISSNQSVDVLSPPGVYSIRIIAQDGYELPLGDAVTLDVQHGLIGDIPPGGLITTWTSSNPTVATVDASGTVRGVALGNTVITATSYGVSASITVVIVAPPPITPPPTVSGITSVSITPPSVVLYPGGRGGVNANVVATTNPPTQGGLGWPVQWTSSDPTIVAMPTVLAQYMNYDAVGEGTATITASLGGKTATSTVYVATARSLAVAPSAATLTVGQQIPLVPTVSSTGPLPSSGYPVTYSSSSPLVATVSPAGVVTALGVGTTRIWVRAGVITTPVPVTVTGQGLTMIITGSATTPGSVTQTAQGYQLTCNFAWTAAPTGSGVARWGKWAVSTDGVSFYETTYNGFRAPTVAAGQTALGMGATYSGPVTPTIAPWSVTMRFRYAENASDVDLYGFATMITVDRTFVCSP